MAILSVRLSGVPRPGTESSPGEIQTHGFQFLFSPYGSLEPPVSNEVILVPRGEEIPL